MKLAHDTPLEVWLRQAPGVERRVGRLAAQRRQIFFEYDPAWLASGPALSPFHLPPRPGLYRDPQHVFEGLPGLCHDSLPDGWGRLLMDRQARKLGLRGLTPLDRLACVGERGMGALVYRPAVSLDAAQGPLDLDVLAHHAAEVLAGEAEDLLVELLRLGGSPAGARPKVLLARVPDGTWTHGEADPPAEHEPWLVKFPARTDPEDIGAVEEAYARMARAAGVEVMPTALFPSATGPGWFGTRRFDRVAGRRVHVHSLSGLLHADHRVPTLDYADLLKATFLLTKDHGEVVRQFRRAVFNVRAHNRDDHSRQFAFVLSDGGDWRLAPAYDLTCADGP
ncbi:MAG: type II toxin-antitoxin system HipA family toxin, partial [Myxococcales bacterium]|nr:type II toxin-antitoxin system HipA family toxin [Myxococcales bacterium]